MKIDDAALISYLVEQLRPLTEADPNLLANYVVALLKNNKPKKELQALCISQLLDFLGDESKTFVGNLFHALEDGTIAIRQDAHNVPKAVADSSAAMQPVITSKAGDLIESRMSHIEKIPNLNSGMFSDHEEDGSDDEDDDRNHKHRRRVSRSRSPNRDFQDVSVRKRNRLANNGRMIYHDGQSMAESGSTDFYMERDGGSKRRPGREQSYGSSSRPGVDGTRGIIRPVSAFRGEGSAARLEHPNGLSRGVVGRGRGNPITWGQEQRIGSIDGSDFNLTVLPPGPSINMYAGRSTSYRGHSSWTGYAQFSGVTNGALAHTASLNSGTRGVSVSGAVVGMNVGIGMPVGRPRCPDFEERGYCLRGDLCPLEHGANRIVVDDVQSLSKFNLPVALPSGRTIALGSMSNSSSSFGQYSTSLGISSLPVQETNVSNLDATNLPKGTAAANVEPDVYDPDQPLWNKEQPSDRLRKLPSFRRGLEDNGSENLALEQNADKGVTAGSQNLMPGQSVWTRIGRIDRGDVKSGSIARNNPPLQHSRVLKKELMEDHEPQISPKKLERNYNGGDEKTSIVPDINIPDGDGHRISEKLGVSPRAKWNTAAGNERAQRTLYVGCIPNNMNKKEQLKAHFQKFGEIMDIRIPSQGDRAFVQFIRREDAEAALKSPEAVMGNRFIRLSWAKRDSVPVSIVDGTASSIQNVSVEVSAVKVRVLEASMKGKAQFGVSESLAERKHKTSVSAIQPSPSNVQPAVVNINQKKQEELENLKEELRKKQEELALKRDEFRRKLERLSKQNTGVREEIEDIHSTNLDGSAVKEDPITERPVKAEASVGDSGKRISSAASKGSLVNDQPDSGAVKDGTKPFNSSAQTSCGSTSQLSPANLKGHSPRSAIGSGFPGSSQWVAVRYKLDNRTTVFRIVPPFPGGPPAISSLKEHFSQFDELVNVESEDMDKSTGGFRVTFSTRSAAELAFVQGKWYHGTVLQFTWANPSLLSTASALSITSAHVEESSSNNGPAQKAPGGLTLSEMEGTRTDGLNERINVNEETKITESGHDPKVDAGDSSALCIGKACV